jgi:hypothetical protein
MRFIYGKTSFTLEAVKGLKTKEQFTAHFERHKERVLSIGGRFEMDIDKAWIEVEKARPTKKAKKKKEEG